MRVLSASSQTEPNSNPTRADNDEIDAEKEPKNVKARDRPMRKNDYAKQKRDEPGGCNPDPGHFLSHAKRQGNPHGA
jgi:hypothetical protein